MALDVLESHGLAVRIGVLRGENTGKMLVRR